MAKRVFFSFHYQDVVDFRANVVRNHDAIRGNQAGYFDKSIWEEARKDSPIALKRMINEALIGTSVTCVLIGSETYQRPWVIYEIFRSIYKGNALIGVHINNISCKNGKKKSKGSNPFSSLGVFFSEDSINFAFVNRVGNEWHYWTEIESRRFHKNSYFPKETAAKYANKILTLSNVFEVYDWIDDDGYENFESWIS